MSKGNAGINKLATVLQKRMADTNKSPLTLDFGVITANNSLLTNTYPIPIPRSDYLVLDGWTPVPGLRVLVAWVQNDAVVVGTIS